MSFGSLFFLGLFKLFFQLGLTMVNPNNVLISS